MLYIHIFQKKGGAYHTMDGVAATSYSAAVDSLVEQWPNIPYGTNYLTTYVIDGEKVDQIDLKRVTLAIVNDDRPYSADPSSANHYARD